MAARTAPLLNRFILSFSWVNVVVGGLLRFFVLVCSKGEPAEKPRSQKIRGAYRKRTSAVFCFSFATNKTRAVPFYGALCRPSGDLFAGFLRRRRAGIGFFAGSLQAAPRQHHHHHRQFVCPFFLGVNARRVKVLMHRILPC